MFDVDKLNVFLDWYDLGVFVFNIIVINCENGYVYLIYGFEVFIWMVLDGCSVLLCYVVVVENVLREKFGVDIGYVGFICKNFLNLYW